KEIDNKFDEIVEFSGVEKFIDTPVKRYSSGMYVRLAFAVAAHLEPEILLVDEVLAVGDVEFQKKCLGKMKDIAAGGRTVLFVSHNMAAIQSLCKRAIVLENGGNIFDGGTNESVEIYLSKSQQLANVSLNERTDREGTGEFKVVDCVIGIEGDMECGYWQTGKDCFIQFKYITDISTVKNVDIGLALYDQTGRTLFFANTIVTKKRISLRNNDGVIICKIKRLPINPDKYYINYDVYDKGVLLDKLENAILVPIETGDFYGTGVLWGGHGTVLTDYKWY
ncbi:MAG: ABC transporter ATP-binding protein, partial [Euryarchaeota archaeon HGW-Euryarchaeota-1]